MTAHCHHLLLLKHREDKTHKKTTKKKTKKGEGAYLQALVLPSHFWFPLLLSRFCTFVSSAFSWHLLLFKWKKKKTQRKKKNCRKQKICKEGKELTFKLLLYPFILGSYFCLLASTLSFQALSLCIFLFSNRRRKKKHKEKKTIEKKKKCKEGKELTSSQIEEKKKHKGRKNHREEKKCKEGRELTFLLSLLHLG